MRSLRVRVILTFLIGTGLLVSFTFVILRNLFLDSYLGLEEEEVTRNVERARDALSSAGEQLDIKLSDWSIWDDTYTFIEDSNPE